MDELLLFHTGRQEIRVPDIRRGRRNADFGQGFYLTPDADFARRWAGPPTDTPPILNTYRLDMRGLCVRTLERDGEWFDYISANRAGRADLYPEADVVFGPIANDTVFDLLGITTSGFLKREQSLRLLTVGPCWRQAAVKTDRAAANLVWQSARPLSREELAAASAMLRKEEEACQRLSAAALSEMTGAD